MNKATNLSKLILQKTLACIRADNSSFNKLLLLTYTYVAILYSGNAQVQSNDIKTPSKSFIAHFQHILKESFFSLHNVLNAKLQRVFNHSFGKKEICCDVILLNISDICA